MNPAADNLPCYMRFNDATLNFFKCKILYLQLQAATVANMQLCYVKIGIAL